MQVDSNNTIFILGGEHLAMIKEVMTLLPMKFEVKDMDQRHYICIKTISTHGIFLSQCH